jgi:hypothetical protein
MQIAIKLSLMAAGNKKAKQKGTQKKMKIYFETQQSRDQLFGGEE